MSDTALMPIPGMIDPVPVARALDGAAMQEVDNGLDVAVQRTLAHGGDVLAISVHRDLDPVEGIGALLRF